ncbi:replication initiator protein A [Asticcacaulis sp. BYS171W]|uniref:Replication initiator protein A n=1 Tax=Asticcacaulis aquaticus TaxID=2984212 RepID=A0ABT5HWU2_9CAUL|nr:replication initiator protein A [Asticcacaulis aquaticus]MDC7684398.1 replication initiator protein A [Asticcacaulis aquaticus]
MMAPAKLRKKDINMVSGKFLRIEKQASLFAEEDLPSLEEETADPSETEEPAKAGRGRGGKAERSALLPERHAPDLFFLVEPVGDLTFKGDMASLEHPLFSLSMKPDLKIRKYEHRDVVVTVTPSVKGLANIYDFDILIYLMSHLRRAMNDGLPTEKLIRFTALDFLQNTNRPTGGSGYNSLRDGLERLAGTRIGTNIKTGGEKVYHNFTLIDHFTIVREEKSDRMLEVEVRISDWLYRAVDAKEVLTVHRDYFRLRGALERKLYQLARKHCGTQTQWPISFEVCHKKSGAQSSMKEFRRMVRDIVEENERSDHFPDYKIHIEESNIVFTKRLRTRLPRTPAAERKLRVSLETYEKAKAVAPGYDVYALEAEWRDMSLQVGEPVKNPDAAFLGYCKFRAGQSPKR